MYRKNRAVLMFIGGLMLGFLLNFIFNFCPESNTPENVSLNFTNKILLRKIAEIELNRPKENTIIYIKENSIIYTKCNYSARGPKVFCAVFTHSKAHSKLHYVHNTWGKRCDKILYFSGPKDPDQVDDPKFELVYLDMVDKYERITEKTLLTFEYIYENFINEYDWFVRANDDTYIIMENLKVFLANRCSDDMSIYGKVLKYRDNGHIYNYGDNSKGFLQGGSGFIISRKSLRLFVESMIEDPKFCVMYRGSWEDQEIANCFRKINVYPGETRDELNRERFFMDQFHQVWESPSRDYFRYSLNRIKLVFWLFLIIFFY